MAKILAVDDEKGIRDSLDMILQYQNHEVFLAADGREALSIFEKEEFDIVLLDIKMPGMDGIEVLEKVKLLKPDVQVVMISGHGDIQTAMEAAKKGAYDFLEKPLDENRILISIRNAISQKKLSIENKELRSKTGGSIIIWESERMKCVMDMIDRVAPTEARVLITGENGSGKELVARAIHHLSPRSDGPFVDVNCAAIPGELIESELFGHEKGSFTGAYDKRKGKFEQAQSGTIFLDEIGDMSLAAQAKVLRVLEENKVERVGGNKPVAIDVRVITATNKDLSNEVQEGRFREDLFYRLNVVPINLPSLKSRIEDIPKLVSHFLVEFSEKNARPTLKISEQALSVLKSHSWPGNVRELRNLIERLVILCPSDVIEPEHVKNFITPPKTPKIDDMLFSCKTFEDFKNESEKLFLYNRLASNNWNVKKTADDLAMERSNLYKKMEKYGLIRP